MTCGGRIGWPKNPEGVKKRSQGCPIELLARVAYSSGVSPVSACTLFTVIIVLAGIGERPPATMLLNRSTPIRGSEGTNGQFTPPEAICASVRLPTRALEKHPPLKPLNRGRLVINEGEPYAPRGKSKY